MLITNITNEDEIKQIHNGSFPLPNLNDPLYFTKKLAINNGQIVAAGFGRLTCEAIVIVDEKQPLISRVNAIKELMDLQLNEAKNLGLSDCHAFVKRHKMLLFLAKMGFTELLNEIPMMIRL